MQPAVSQSPQAEHLRQPASHSHLVASPPSDEPPAPAVRNFAVMVAYQVVVRTGWIFKTESIIMPAVLDTLGGAGWLRGCLPLLNRFGTSVPPLLMARRVKVTTRKKRVLATCTLIMSATFLLLSLLWWRGGAVAAWWMPAAFLALYSSFFMSTGVNQLAFSTLQGKLIPTTLRGRLMLVSNVLGAVCAISCALVFLSAWLERGSQGFVLLFGFSGTCFALAAAISLLLAEPPDDYHQPTSGVVQTVSTAWNTVRHDANFGRLSLIAALFGTAVLVFPHYQALGFQKMGLKLSDMMWWVVVQNAGTALFSLLIGPLADQRGNRLVLRTVLLCICGAPLAALILPSLGSTGRSLFPFVFLLVGLTPVAIKSFHNYTLEISQPADHPRYLSSLSLCIALPVMCSPLVGLLVDVAGFHTVFAGVASCILIGWVLTFGLNEPRHHPAENAEGR